MATVTVTKKSDSVGCPIISPFPAGAIPVSVVEPGPGRTLACFLRTSSSLFAAVQLGDPVTFPEAELPARIAADEFVGGYIRDSARQTADAATQTAQVTDAAKVTALRADLATFVVAVRSIPPGARTPEQKTLMAIIRLLLGLE